MDPAEKRDGCAHVIHLGDGGLLGLVATGQGEATITALHVHGRAVAAQWADAEVRMAPIEAAELARALMQRLPMEERLSLANFLTSLL
jgi:hypothetical protein